MGKQSCNKCEILSPAGGLDAVRAAVLNGADAVYLGQKLFSARQNAENFDRDALEEAVLYCRLRDVKVYQTLNTLIFDFQQSDAAECIKTACDAGVDGLIIQDMGVYALCRALCPDMPLHASTQMSVHTVEGARALKELGFSRVVLAREMSFEEIREVCSDVDIETEVFVHGALCMSVSGQCYISGMLGGRSGNRGCCAGTCRMPFSADGGQNQFALSLKDMCLAEEVKRLAEIGVTSLKIEGRMKRPEYVAAATRAYYNALNDLPYDIASLRAIFSRSGFTDGYFVGKLGEEMFGTRQKDDVTSATSALLRELQNTYKKENGKIPLNMQFSMKSGAPARLFAEDGDKNSAEAFSDAAETAVNRPTDEAAASASLSKLGGTVFTLGSLSCDIGGGLAISASALNGLRREVCEKIAAQREKIVPIRFLPEKLPLPKGEPRTENADMAFRAEFKKYAQLGDLPDRLEAFSLPLDEISLHENDLLPYKDKLFCAPDRLAAGREAETERTLSRLFSLGFTRLLCNNLSHIEIGKKLGFTLHGGSYLNVVNSLALHEYAKMGLTDQMLSFEIQLKDADKIVSEIPIGGYIYGSLALMLTRNCPIKGRLSCAECGGGGILTDRLGERFRVYCNGRQSFEVLNSRALYMADRLREMKFASFGVFAFFDETAAECKKVFSAFKNAADGSEPPSPPHEFTRGLYYRSI